MQPPRIRSDGSMRNVDLVLRTLCYVTTAVKQTEATVNPRITRGIRSSKADFFVESPLDEFSEDEI
jgi:hypothetical protein